VKKIEAIIKPHLFDEVKDALVELGVVGMTVSEVVDTTRPGKAVTFRGTTSKPGLVPQLKLEIVVPSERLASAVIRAIEETAKDSGKIFVTEVLEAIRIRTGDWGEAAI
jgi:nitrogen regulatory protein P-II 1